MAELVAKYQQYAECKDSGVEWLDVVPRHWEAIKFDYVINSIGDIDHYMPNSIDTGIPYVMTGDLQDLVSKINFENCKQVAYGDYFKLSRKIKASKGDVILARYATIGTLSYVDIDADFLVSYSCVIIKPNVKRTSGRYLFFYLKSQAFLQAIRIYINSNTQGNVGIDSLRNVKIIIPPVSEQNQIANFLDHETAQIDTLIDKQQTLIQLLKEKRQAVISHAVTKGLNPDAPMKDSGVEWLGEVPEHWEVTKLGFHTSKIGSGKTPRGGAEVYQEEGVLFLRSQNVYNDSLRIDKSESVFISEVIHEEMSNTKVQGGDILLNVTGGSIGRTCIVPDNFIEANVNQHVCIVRLPTSMRYFVAFLLKSSLIKEQIDSIQTGGNREGLNFEQISKFIICLPPEKERKDIVDYIESETNKIDNLLEQANTAIQLMQERRTALISAAVTGKIDVRGWRVPDVNEEFQLTK